LLKRNVTRKKPEISARGAAAITAGVLLAALGAFAWAAVWVVGTVDGRALARQQLFAARGIEQRFADVPVEQESITLWDDSVVHAKRNDQAWMEENLTVWMGTYFGHDRIYVLNERDRPIQAMHQERIVPVVFYELDRTVLEPLVAELRSEIAAASAGLADSTAEVGPLGVSDFVEIGGKVAIASVKPIVPSTVAVAQAPGTEFLHVSLVLLDEDALGAIAAQYELEGVMLSRDGRHSEASVPIVDRGGRTLAWFQWNAYQPGTLVVKGILPALVFVGALLVGLLTWLLVQVFRAATELEARERTARHQALHDALTGLPNRVSFDQRMAGASRSRPEQSVCVLLVDIDEFKAVNDTLGHAAGDELIQGVGRLFGSLATETTPVFRLGGDEFAFLIEGKDASTLGKELAEHVLVAMQKPFVLAGEPSFVTASIGIADSPSAAAVEEDLLRKADIALYAAKAKGRNTYSTYVNGLEQILEERRVIERDLRAALLAGDQLYVVYQPMFAGDGKKIVGAEALARWEHPKLGLISPEVFVGIAEKRGLIDALGMFVLERACAAAIATGIGWVSVNVSRVQLRERNFARRVLGLLLRFGLPPGRLQLEVTETVFTEDSEAVDRTLSELRKAGIRIALDDFGTGYASLNYLNQYPLDKIKIDQSFVRKLGESGDSDAVVRAIVGLARAMKKYVAAEGVETAHQRDYLAAIGCHELQGWYLAKPMSESDLAAFLARRTFRLAAREDDSWAKSA
jgi:diguanylate cyclase (GGDEF)-like protein